MATVPDDLPEAVYWTVQILKKQHEMVSRLVLDSEALAAALDQLDQAVPGISARFLKERAQLNNGRTALLLAETSKVLDSLIERLKATYGPLEN
jgi:hypothetical protein